VAAQRAGHLSRRYSGEGTRVATAGAAEFRLVDGVTLSGKLDGAFARRSSTYGGTGTMPVAWQSGGRANTSRAQTTTQH
jgi:hypothetical protein